MIVAKKIGDKQLDDNISIEVIYPSHWFRVLDAEKIAKRKKVKTYESREIQTFIGITKTQIIHWTQRGLIIPYKDARGRGNAEFITIKTY